MEVTSFIVTTEQVGRVGWLYGQMHKPATYISAKEAIADFHKRVADLLNIQWGHDFTADIVIKPLGESVAHITETYKAADPDRVRYNDYKDEYVVSVGRVVSPIPTT